MAQLNKDAEMKDSNLGKNAAEKTLQNPAQAIEKFSHDVGTKIGSVAGEITDRANDYVSNTRSYVKEHPIQSVAIAAATGAAVGTLITMVSRRRH